MALTTNHSLLAHAGVLCQAADTCWPRAADPYPVLLSGNSTPAHAGDSQQAASAFRQKPADLMHVPQQVAGSWSALVTGGRLLECACDRQLAAAMHQRQVAYCRNASPIGNSSPVRVNDRLQGFGMCQ